VPILEAVADRLPVGLVVTQPDRPAGRGKKLVATPVKDAARARGLATATPEKLRPFADDLRERGIDLLVVASYGRIVPQAVLDVPAHGALNVHPSLLPYYRGATPLQSALRDGRTTTACTIIAMDAGMDTGDVVLQERTPIAPDETYGTLHDRLAARGAALIVRAIDLLEAGTLVRTPQATLAERFSAETGDTLAEIAATTTRPIAKSDWLLDWSHPVRRVVDQVRSLAPAPAARALLGDVEPAKIVALRVVPAEEARAQLLESDAFLPSPGVVVADAPSGELYVRAGDGWVAVVAIVPPGRNQQTGREFAATLRRRAVEVPS
jgi:methionyl-tRNA formyltransferase